MQSIAQFLFPKYCPAQAYRVKKNHPLTGLTRRRSQTRHIPPYQPHHLLLTGVQPVGEEAAGAVARFAGGVVDAKSAHPVIITNHRNRNHDLVKVFIMV
jgi:hypothetical protein